MKVLFFALLVLAGQQAFAGTMINQGDTFHTITLKKKSDGVELTSISSETYISSGSFLSRYSLDTINLNPAYDSVLDTKNIHNLSPSVGKEIDISRYAHFIVNYGSITSESEENREFASKSEAIDFAIEKLVKDTEERYISYLNDQDEEHEISDIEVTNNIEVRDLKCKRFFKKISCEFSTKNIFAAVYKSKYSLNNLK